MSATVHSDHLQPVAPDSETRVGSLAAPGVPTTAAFPFLRPPSAPGEIGRLGGYRLFKLIGAGGMGKVFLAEDLALQRDVALKVMCPPAGEDLLCWRERFLREARALAAIKHPNLVTVYQAGDDRGTVFLAMELLEGETLDARIRRAGPLDVCEVLRIAEQVAAGLAAIHDRELIHRDIKPANIWLGAPSQAGAARSSDETEGDVAAPAVGAAARVPHSEVGVVKILDFGLVREVKGDTQLTEAGVVVGTPAYMSPEQMRGKPLDHRTDLFSFGCVLFALCTGRTPFDADSPMAQAAALAADIPVRARKLNRAVPKALSDLIAALLEKDPDERPASAAEVLDRLRAVATGAQARECQPEPLPRRSYRWYAIAFVALVWLALAGLTVVALGRPRPVSGTGAAPSTTPVVGYLAELPKLEERVFPPPGAPRPPNADGSVTVGGVRSPHGIFMHGAPPFEPPPFARYALDKKYSRFAAEVAMNDTGGKWCRIGFVVIGDGKELWQSRTISAGDPVERCDVDVRNVSTLTLELRTFGPEQGAHGAWIEPQLTK